MAYMDHPCYAGIVADLDNKYRARDEAVERLLAERDADGIWARARAVRQRLRAGLTDPALEEALGSMQCSCAGSVSCGDYRIENIRLSYRLGYEIPVNVYVPASGSGKHPAIVVSIGHWPDGKAIPANQILCANLARNGFIVAAYDPLCQGERRPYDDAALRRVFGELPEDLLSVSMHMQVGNLAYMLGKNVAALFVKDSISVVDYLCTRGDVDQACIGCTGQSGGGTQSLYLSAMDDRIRFVSPIQCISKMRLVNPDGIGDCEQSLIGISAREGFDYPDLLWASFPKPILLSGALLDECFPAAGAQESEREIRRLYEVMNMGDRFSAGFASCGHEISADVRQFAYAWFSAQMHGRAALPEAEVPLFDAEIHCLRDDGSSGRPQDVYLSQLQRRRVDRPQTAEQVRAALRALVLVDTEDVRIENVSQADGDCAFSVSSGSGRETLCRLTPRESDVLTVRISETSEEGAALWIAPFGLASAAQKALPAYDIETAQFYAAVVLGETIMAQRLQHILWAVTFSMEQTGCSSAVIAGDGVCSLLALLASCLEPRIGMRALSGLPQSLEDFFIEPSYLFPETLILPGLLDIADIPALLTATNQAERP